MRFWFAVAICIGVLIVCAYGLYAASHIITISSLWS